MNNFDELRRRAKDNWRNLQQSHKPVIFVGSATCGRSAGSLDTLAAFKNETEKQGIDATFVEVGCIGLCYAEPVVIIKKPGKPGVCYGEVDGEKAAKIVQGYLVGDDPLGKLAMGTLGEEALDGIPKLFETPVLKDQVRRVLRNCGFIDPANIDHYLANEGYEGFLKALKLGSAKVMEEVKKSGLRGRGGAGFPTWRKWQFCIDSKGDRKYLVCNADEGDPGAFMNRSLLEGDPHSLLEGMLIGGFTLGASEGYIYCRAEYPLALERLGVALQQARDYGLLGENILGSPFSFDIKVKEGAGAFVCGEETALIASIEGKRGMPRPRPPFPAVSGLRGKPTVINNVETFASVALIMQKGADWFAEYGTEESKGTKTFALVGRVKRTGLVEVPLGTTLKTMIFDIGGGVADDRKFKAVQTGGPSGGCIPYDRLDIPVDYDTLKEAGSIMGSGGMVVMDETTCMVDFARYFLDFAQKESCGECIPCRLGTKQLLTILTDIAEGRGRPDDIDLLEEIAEGVKAGSLCGLGQTAPNPVLTTVRYFRDEYEAHIMEKRCPAAVCKELISSPCQHICPIGAEAPVYISLIAQKRYKEAWQVIRKDNPLPSVCARVCHHPCEMNCQAGKWGEPIGVRALKRFVTDYALEHGFYSDIKKPTIDKEKVAIVGSGPAGLSAAYFLAQEGYDVTVFEEHEVPGGALYECIPEFRLPKEIIKKDIQNIVNSGVTIKTNIRIGRDISFDELTQDYSALFVAVGAHKSRKLGIPGEDADGVIDAMEYLRKMNLGEMVPLGKRVGVIGGGNSAIDAARVAIRDERCENVFLIYRRTRKEMPAFAEEVEEALEEGVQMQFLAAPSKVVTENGKIKALECIRMKLGEEDASGRPRPVPVEGSEFLIDLDTLIVAISEEGDLSFISPGSGLNVSKWKTVEADSKTFATNMKGVFAGGDIVTGPNTVIEAMAAGKVAAKMIDKYIRGETVAAEYQLTRPSMYIPPVELTEEEIESAERFTMPCLVPYERARNFKEVELGLTEEMAVKEARRCLRCDLETCDGKRWLEQLEKSGVAKRE